MANIRPVGIRLAVGVERWTRDTGGTVVADTMSDAVVDNVPLPSRSPRTGGLATAGPSAAQTAAALVRSMGLVGLVRPATTPTAFPDSAAISPVIAPVTEPGPHPDPPAPAKPAGRPKAVTKVVRGTGRAHSAVPRLRLAAGTGVAAGTNSGNIAGGLGAPDRMLPVIHQLRPLLPGGGLRRGSTVATSGATSLVIGLLAAASRAGSWCAVVGLPTFGTAAAAEAGVELSRLALVPYPGPEWSTVVAAMLDGVDVVVTAPPGPVAAGLTGRLAARARQRGSVLIGYGRWPGADVLLTSTRGDWEGLDGGRGRLRKRKLTVTARGRGAAAQPKEATFWLPAYEALGAGWSVDRWREGSDTSRYAAQPPGAGAERTLSLIPPPDITIAPDGPFVDEREDESDYTRQEAAS
jgi:hypothetical protein